MKKITKTSLVLFTIGILLLSCMIPAVSSVDIKQDVETKNEKVLNNSKAGDGVTDYYAVISACASYKDPSANLPVGPLKLRVLYFSLLAADNWKMQNIILLINEDASRDNLLNALSTMASRVDEDDVFLFSWMGHGSQVPDDGTDERTILKPLDRFDEVICPWDCKRNRNGELENFIRDDELEQKFDAIGGKGQCLIFESCFSGGLVSKGLLQSSTTGQNEAYGFEIAEAYDDDFISPEEAEAFTEDFTSQFDEDDVQMSSSDLENKNSGTIITSDLNGNKRIVIMASMDDCVARLTLLFGGPLTTGLALGFLGILKGDAKDKNHNGFLSVEEAFQWARPRSFGLLGLYWGFVYLYCLAINADYNEDFYDGIPWFKDPDFYKAMINGIPEGTKMFIGEFLYIQIVLRLSYGVWAWSFPHKVDRYLKPGGLDIIDLKDHEETDALDTKGLPASFCDGPTQAGYDHYVNYLLTNTPLKDCSEEIQNKWIISEEDYLSNSWDNVPDQYKPAIAAEISAKTTEEEAKKEIQFYGEAIGGFEPITYKWDFGDGTTSNKIDPVHAYTEAGTYTVSLTVTDGQGNIAMDLNDESNIPKLTITIKDETSRVYSHSLMRIFLKHFPILQSLLNII